MINETTLSSIKRVRTWYLVTLPASFILSFFAIYIPFWDSYTKSILFVIGYNLFTFWLLSYDKYVILTIKNRSVRFYYPYRLIARTRSYAYDLIDTFIIHPPSAPKTETSFKIYFNNGKTKHLFHGFDHQQMKTIADKLKEFGVNVKEYED